MSTEPLTVRGWVLVVAIGWMIIGGFGACGATMMLVPAWQAAHGRGHTGNLHPDRAQLL
jgi:hypothetical protein